MAKFYIWGEVVTNALEISAITAAIVYIGFSRKKDSKKHSVLKSGVPRNKLSWNIRLQLSLMLLQSFFYNIIGIY